MVASYLMLGSDVAQLQSLSKVGDYQAREEKVELEQWLHGQRRVRMGIQSQQKLVGENIYVKHEAQFTRDSLLKLVFVK